METLEKRIQDKFYRLTSLIGINPTYLIVNPKFVKYLLDKYDIEYSDIEEHLSKNKTNYIGMDIKRSEDIEEDDFLLSFHNLDL